MTLDQIKIQIGEESKNYFTDAHELFLNVHPEICRGNVKSIDKLDSKKGTFLVIIYENSAVKYEATALVDLSKTVK